MNFGEIFIFNYFLPSVFTETINQTIIINNLNTAPANCSWHLPAQSCLVSVFIRTHDQSVRRSDKLLLVLASAAIFGSASRGTHYHISLSRDSGSRAFSPRPMTKFNLTLCYKPECRGFDSQ
jgi:hypothetical protein